MPIINQLFLKKPTLDILIQVIQNLGIQSLNDNHKFTIKDLEKRNTLQKMLTIIPNLQEYYLPCKHKTFLHDLNLKKCITIARQILKLYDYDIMTEEKSLNNKKYLIYFMVHENDKEIIQMHKNKGNKEYILFFD